MQRLLPSITLAVAVTLPGVAAAETFPSGAWRSEAIDDVVDELLLLGHLDAWEDDEVIAALTSRYGVDAPTEDALVEELLANADEALELAVAADEAGLALSAPVETALEPVPDEVLDRLRSGERRFLDPTAHLEAVADLALRDGAAPIGPRESSERTIVLDVLAAPAGFGVDEEEDVDAADALAPAAADVGTSVPWAPVAAVALMVGGVAGALRRRGPGSRSG